MKSETGSPGWDITGDHTQEGTGVRGNMERPDCYKCKHRHDLPGNAHSTCEHPLLKSDLGTNPLNIKGRELGIKRGWFLFPFNFDPVWLLNCDGFTENESGERR